MPSLPTIAKDLRRELRALEFGPPVAYVYRPLEYAWGPHSEFLERWGSGPKNVVFVGMNPGPWGMAQTGIPFGCVSFVADWLALAQPRRRGSRRSSIPAGASPASTAGAKR